jgi:hypothetical protein
MELILTPLLETHYNYADVDPNDKWDRPNTTTSFHGIQISKENYQYQYNLHTIDRNDYDHAAYVVLVKYNSGDTFGHDSGLVDILEVFNNQEDAVEFAIVAEKTDDPKNPSILIHNSTFKYKDKEYYRPWVGYFNSLDYIWVYELSLSNFPKTENLSASVSDEDIANF